MCLELIVIGGAFMYRRKRPYRPHLTPRHKIRFCLGPVSWLAFILLHTLPSQFPSGFCMNSSGLQ